MSEINWSEQHCGVHRATAEQLMRVMPDLGCVLADFPRDPIAFTWDVKVHMLMPRQYPCVPGWHFDNVPRVGGRAQEPDPREHMWLWISGPPLTQFRNGYIKPRTWVRFAQSDEHRGTPASEFCWRGFIRATPVWLLPPNPSEKVPRRHAQVYLDAGEFSW